MIIFISVVHSLSFSSLRRITNSVQDESFVNCIYSKVAGKSSNDLSHVDFNIRDIFLNKLRIDRIRYGSLIADTKITITDMEIIMKHLVLSFAGKFREKEV